MGKKNDLYINYDSYYKKRSRKGKNKAVIVAFILILGLGLALTTYLTIKAQMKPNGNDPLMISPSITPTIAPVATATSAPTPFNTPTPSGVLIPTAKPSSSDLTEDQEDIATSNDISRKPTVAKGIYVSSHTAGTKNMEKLINLALTTEINAMVIDIKDDHGKISYKMDSALISEIGAATKTISDMKTLVTTLKERDIYLIARIVAFKDPYLAETRQELAVKNKDGSLFRDNNGDGWVNPYNTKVWDYLIEIATQAAAIGFDEIQFDYIRFSTGTGMKDADFGKEAKTKSREEIITEFTKYAYERIKPLGVYMSADVYGAIISSSVDAGIVGQNYVEMAKYLDYICPMIYPSHFGEGNYGIKYPDLEPYNIIKKSLTSSEEKLRLIPEGEHRAIVRPWLQDFTATWVKPHLEYGGEELREQIKAVYEVGYEEWLLWNSTNRYSEDGLDIEE